jgi:DNA invertase Pin-like site-specific DNA recombinase
VVREFAVAESAKRGAERLAFNEMFQWVRTNARKEKITAILSHKLDRVCRNMRDAVRLQELEDACGVQLAFVENQFGPGAAGALSFNVMAAVAQYYSDNLRAEVLKGMDEKVRQGWPTGLAPFGYVNTDDKDEPVQPHPVEAKAVQRIFELYSTGQNTFERLGDQLAAEGLVYRPSQPRFNRTALSYILNNRFYVGELARNGSVHTGKYRLLIDRRTFDACRDILLGRNRRTGNPTHLYAGGMLRCACCGRAMTGETIRRALSGGGVNEHVYYKCGHPDPGDEHPVVRWKECDLERAILDDLGGLRIPDADLAGWFRDRIQRTFADTDVVQGERRRALTKRRSELAGMHDRLLNGYLAGVIDDTALKAKSTELKRELAAVEESLAQAERFDPEAEARALAVFDFSQNLENIWRGSNSAVRREIVECVSSNRTLSDVTLVLEKRKPFDLLAERLSLKIGRGDWI